MTYLLDVNVLIALIDPGHVAHGDAHDWFDAEGRQSWATCPITENGLIRIVGNPRYPDGPGSPAIVVGMLEELRRLPGHVFWTDEVGLVADEGIDGSKILTPGQVTDTYLLALAKARRGQLATFDRRMSVNAVKGGKSALHLIPTR